MALLVEISQALWSQLVAIHSRDKVTPFRAAFDDRILASANPEVTRCFSQ